MTLTTAPGAAIAGEPASPARGASERSGPGRGAGPLRDRCLFAAVVVGRCYRALICTLTVVAMVPMLWGWTTYLVRSGSMEPTISVGDVVVARPFGAHQKVPVGRVMLFEAPTGVAGTPAIRLHRVVASLPDERFTTAGDANASNDARPVPRADFRAQALILVPYVGRPVAWLAERNLVALALWLAVTALLLHLSFRRIDGDPPRRQRPRRPHRRRRATSSAMGLLAVATVLMTVLTSGASAAFTDSTRSAGNTWKAAAALVQAYTSAVMADAPYAFHRLDETSGASAADSSGNGRTGTYTSVATYHQAGALPNNAGYSIALNGSTGRMVGGGTGLTDPTTFSVEVWFRTTTSAGGKLIGFEDTRNQTSTFFDREAFMRTDGRVVYMGATSTSKLLVSPAALNNGAWHQLVVTAAPSGSNEATVMYVDGVQVASGSTAKAALSYTGWWRVGYGRVPTGSLYPTTGNFTGSLDDVAVYRTQLSAARVAAHYAAR